ncbi:MAG: Na/Pi symporter [Kiritimatiellia bacterium]
MKSNVKWILAGLWIAGAAFAQAGETLSIKGSDTFSAELGLPLISAFKAQNDGIDVALTGLGSASGIADLLEDTCDIAVSSRSLDETEQRMARSKDIELKSAIAGYYGVALVVNAENPLKDLSDATIRDVFIGQATNWKQVGGPDRPIEVLIRDATGGSHLGFRELAMDNQPYAAHARAFASYEELAQAVAARPDAIGYVEMNLVSQPGLRPLSINGIPPNEITVQKGVYPYVQPVWLYARAKSTNAAIERFIQFVRSKPGQEIVESVGFVPVDLIQLDGRGVFFLVFQVLGGLALFIFGMNIMSDGLREAAGQRLRSILSVMTTRKLSGLGLGTLLGTLVHSSATTVMLVGFIHAGLMTLVQAVPVMLGANVGTTLSMQAISFKLSDYALFAVTVGFLVSMVAKTTKRKKLGLSLMGFGLLFLGMTLMSDAIKPHRELLKPIMAGISAETPKGLVLGILVATLLTSIIQSSGATIGMAFALVTAGVLTSVEQTMPIILGAHIGTCATALLGSIGTSISAKRLAYSHLIFNVLNVAVASLLKGPLVALLVWMSPDNVLRQSANLHTVVMVVAAFLMLPFSAPYARLITRVFRSRKPEPEPSYLDDKLLDFPEQAICACMRELQRVAKTCAKSLRLAGQTILFAQTPQDIHAIKLNEQVVNDVKAAMKEYLARLTRRYLSKRQAILIQHLDRCMSDLERIGDHIETICNLSLRRQNVPEAVVDKDSFDTAFRLYENALHLFKLVIDSLDPDKENIQEIAQQILQARDDYMQDSLNTRAMFTDKVAQRLITPIAGIFFSEYIAALDRIVKHSKTIALAEKQPQFWIKRTKLGKHVDFAPEPALQQLVDPKDYLSRLQAEDYL